ncbi:hypothetical protein PILCRDRAFT_396833 [Piloderma croceum F 1598]|uniref:Uncharacterized protein n=1 Tax=Piloderma croceum (strain F 1598) TaxID=765440 RepID=A0A0C3C3C2_PILCF|nr:hypothetical protein PILCRDRAFT_396833 [Piloderma croceum F 1598]
MAKWSFWLHRNSTIARALSAGDCVCHDPVHSPKNSIKASRKARLATNNLSKHAFPAYNRYPPCPTSNGRVHNHLCSHFFDYLRLRGRGEFSRLRDHG